MKKIYESFSEIADDFVNGDHWTHLMSEHNSDECLAWQHGIHEFAEWLDSYGLKLVEDTKAYDILWEEIRSAKPSSVAEHKSKKS